MSSPTMRLSAQFPAGNGSVEWDARDDAGPRVASGVYFISVSSPFGRKVGRAILIK